MTDSEPKTDTANITDVLINEEQVRDTLPTFST